MKEAIKKYFEEAIKTDEALAQVYDEKKLDKCMTYITDQARKHLGGKNGGIEDTIVYKWARDFMYGDIEKPAEDTQKDSVEKEVEKVSDSIPETLSEEQLEPEETNVDDRCCEICGYQYLKMCQKTGAALGNLKAPACKDFIRKATAEDVAAIPTQEKLVIESVQEEKPVLSKAKKSKKVDEYDGPNLFDFDDLY